MLASPQVWWVLIAACVGAAVAGLLVIVRAAQGHLRRPTPGSAAAGGGGLILAGALALWLLLARGPWWVHAPTWVLIDRFPTHAPDLDAANDPVTVELIRRLSRGTPSLRLRQDAAARCVESLGGGPGHSAQTGLKAIAILVQLGEEKYPHTPAILALLSANPPPPARLRSEILTEIPRLTDLGPDVLPVMASIVADDTEGRYQRCRAAWALRCMGPRAADAAGALAAALEAPEDPKGRDSVSTAAARALARIGPAAASAGSTLDRVAADPQRPRQARTAARLAASIIRGEHATEAAALGALLGHEDPEERLLAARWLRWIGEEREAGPAAPALAAAVDDGDDRVADLARQALSNFVSRDHRYLQLLEQAAAGRPAAGTPRLRALIADLQRTVRRSQRTPS